MRSLQSGQRDGGQSGPEGAANTARRLQARSPSLTVATYSKRALLTNALTPLTLTQAGETDCTPHQFAPQVVLGKVLLVSAQQATAAFALSHLKGNISGIFNCIWWRGANLCFTEPSLNTNLPDVPLQVTQPGKTSLDYYKNDSTLLSLYGNLVNGTDFMCDKRQVRQFARAFLPVFFWLIFFVGTVGNALVVLVYCKYHFRRSMMDRYLLHLAIGDLLLLFTLPFWAKAASNGWIFKNFMCKVVNSMYKINFYGCSLFLTCISFDRYITIVQAMKAKTSKQRRLLRSKLMCLTVWLMSMSLCIPEIIYSQSMWVGDITVCKIMYPPNVSMVFRVTVLSLKVTIGFFLPLLVMVICYTLIINTLLQAKRSQKQKSLKIITMIITAFLLSQFPYNVVLMVKAINNYTRVAYSCQAANQLDIGLQVTQSIAFLHSCLNPFLYVFAGERFGAALGRMVRSSGCCQGGGQKQRSSACDSQEHSSDWSSAILGRRRVRNSLTLSTHLASSIMPPPLPSPLSVRVTYQGLMGKIPLSHGGFTWSPQQNVVLAVPRPIFGAQAKKQADWFKHYCYVPRGRERDSPREGLLISSETPSSNSQ
ncbi:PREDICTED: C-C chemokine receptor type 9-like, partial [Phaethon lepturus]|uniref:C-C chemokine receptor type 9-like n=1 Tax=Phaethon lepturus TaxID=97097 RepID=UPI0005305032